MLISSISLNHPATDMCSKGSSAHPSLPAFVSTSVPLSLGSYFTQLPMGARWCLFCNCSELPAAACQAVGTTVRQGPRAVAQQVSARPSSRPNASITDQSMRMVAWLVSLGIFHAGVMAPAC